MIYFLAKKILRGWPKKREQALFSALKTSPELSKVKNLL
jgi:hypothetical protein